MKGVLRKAPLIALCTVRAFNPFSSLVTQLRRPQFEKSVSDLYGSDAEITYLRDRDGRDTNTFAGTSAALWRWAKNAQASGSTKSQVLAFPSATEKQVSSFVDTFQEFLVPKSAQHAGAWSVFRGAAISSLVYKGSGPEKVELGNSNSIDVSAVRARMKMWVDRTLVKLKMCPFTMSAELSGARIEEFGFRPSPIMYCESSAADVCALMASFWEAADVMIQGGDSQVSSIILAAPHWDDRWGDWCEVVFPLLESSVLASGLGRDLGIVCFHPHYATPPDSFLRKHRFGHMYGPSTLRRWAQEANDAQVAALDDDTLRWSGSYQRRSPHAMINVLWSKQLEVR